ncbi:MAG: IS1634 family transposase [Candidatus Scalindua sp.]
MESDSEIEALASSYAEKFIQRNLMETDVSVSEPVFIESVKNRRIRTLGAEYICYSFLRKLELDKCLAACAFKKRQLQIAILLIIGRLVSPGSERHIHYWGQKKSALDELLHTDFSSLSLNSLYKICDKLLSNKSEIESHLRRKECDLFNLDEKIILYDLTNTYFEGRAELNSKARFGNSKEKRKDCRLLTLGLVIDSKGFPKTSEVFSGNQSEPQTLLEMVNKLTKKASTYRDRNGTKPTVVIDAGIATEKNLQELKQGYHYIAVSRKKMAFQPSDDFVLIKEDSKNKIEVQRMTSDGEIFLFCKSTQKANKEKSIQSRYRQNFEEHLSHISQSIHKKGGTKKYEKVIERIGRLKEKYSRIGRFYEIEIEETDGKATCITWKYLEDKSDQHFSGNYYLRTDRTDLTEKQIWDIYLMLKELEDAFRTMKSDLNLRPIFHQKETRSDAHIFITIMGYHILHSIRTRLKEVGIHLSWSEIRNRLSTHCRVTNQMKTQNGKTVFIRQCSEPEDVHRKIYDALKLKHVPCKKKRMTI